MALGAQSGQLVTPRPLGHVGVPGPGSVRGILAGRRSRDPGAGKAATHWSWSTHHSCGANLRDLGDMAGRGLLLPALRSWSLQGCHRFGAEGWTQEKVGLCGCHTWGTRGWVATTSCSDVGPITPLLLLKPGQSLQLWRTEARSTEAGDAQTSAVQVGATGKTKDHTTPHGLRKGKKLARSKQEGRGGAGSEERVHGHSWEPKTFRSRNTVHRRQEDSVVCAQP